MRRVISLPLFVFQETVLHFKKKLGVHLPESTVRGLRAKFQRRFNDDVDVTDDVSELDHHRRGRPMRLGKYDSVVRECIEKLVSSSDEKISSFMAIATARQVGKISSRDFWLSLAEAISD